MLCLRYFDTKKKFVLIQEEFSDFVQLRRKAGEALADEILVILKNNSIAIEAKRDQSYDGTSAMASASMSCKNYMTEQNCSLDSMSF